jgi:hypothetical protein
MAIRGFAALCAVLLVACAAPTPMPMTVESERFPEVTIECGGEPGLTDRECQAWAEQLLESGPIETTRLVLTYRTGNSRCGADYFGANGRMLMTAAAVCPAS